MKAFKIVSRFLKFIMIIESIETNSLILRKISQNDLIDIFEIASDPTMIKFLTWEPHSEIEKTKEFISSYR